MEKKHEVSCTLIIILVAIVALLYGTILGNGVYAIKSPLHRNRDGNCVSNIDQSIINIPVGDLPIRIAYDSVNNRVYVANINAHVISVIDAATLNVIGTVPVGAAVFDVAYDSVNNRVYAPLSTDSVSVIDAATLEVTDTIRVGVSPTDVAYDPVNNRVYSTNPGSHGTVSVISTATVPIQTSAQQAIQKIINTLDRMDLSRGAAASLENTLNAAVIQFNHNNDLAACNLLNVFLHQVDTKEANEELTPDQAADLRQQATAIQDILGCSSSATSHSSSIQNHSIADMINSNNNSPSTLSIAP